MSMPPVDPLKADNALDDHPDPQHTPEQDRVPPPLDGAPPKGRTALKPGGLSEAEQLLEQQKLDRDQR
ncbi:MAG TPA: hypothetical protein VE092_03195 [Herbaspirillum sp.]|uniref:hypothetical protein n=1 Tax=Herbaspirillum sp. TaxID=1890675 RepID=UPI002D522F08|nr:hypothetical protein [Herbaspirillum sp.]HZG18997.1 hypothetical protein [Herbaspirillum sp.]